MRQLLIILCCSLLSTSHASAGVDLRTGNYFVSYTDIEFPNSKADITRSYNSTSTNNGMFGYGWGSIIETRLFALPDGTLLLRWWGGGLGDYYEPAVVDKQGLYKMINAIVNNMVSLGKLANNPVAIAEKKSYFLANNRERAQRYADLQIAKKVSQYLPPANTKLNWVQDMNQTIHWNGSSFEVKSWKDNYRFNNRGLLIAINDEQFTMQLSYQADRLKQVLVDDQYVCVFETDTAGRIIRISMKDSLVGKTAVYKYDSLNNLIYSKDAGNNEYHFSYDRYHNLVRIGYQDKRFVTMQYDPASNRLIKFQDKNGSFQTYQYPYFYAADGKVNYQHYATTVKKHDSLGTLIFTQYREYENRVKDDGSTYLHRLVEKSDTSFHEALYDAEVENASYRKNNNGQAWSRYDAKKRPVFLQVNDTIYSTTYNKLDLPEYFTRIDTSLHDTMHYTYAYNEQKELVNVTKNKVNYKVTRSSDKLWTTLNDGRDEIKISFKNGQPFSIQHARWGITLINDAEWRKMGSTLNPDAYNRTPAPIETAEISSTTREIASAKRSEQEARKEAIARMRKSQTEAKAPDKRAKLLQLWAQFADVLTPKEIRHEWIWEKL